MASKTDTEVIIGGKVFTLSGYESEEYLQKVASYINNKLNEYTKVESFRRQPMDTQHVLLQLNIADDFFKAKKQISDTGRVKSQTHWELARRNIEGYCVTQRRFKGGRKGPAPKSLRDVATKTLQIKYYQERAAGNVSDETNDEMARRFPTQYDKTKRQFTNARCVNRTNNAPKVYKTRRLPNHNNEDEAAYASAALIESTTINRPKRVEMPIVKREIPVYVSTNKSGTLYNINVRGKKLASFEAGAQVQTLADGTLLAVYGIVADDPAMPNKPLWRVYDTNMMPSRYEGYTTYRGYKVYIQSLVCDTDEVKMRLSNGMLVILTAAQLARRAAGRKFKITNNQKTK